MPGNVQVIEAAPEGVKLTWKAPADINYIPVADYLVERCLSDDKKWEPVGTTSDTELTTGRIHEGEHDFRVTARNDIGLSEPAEVKNVVVKAKDRRGKTEGEEMNTRFPLLASLCNLYTYLSVVHSLLTK